MSTAPSDEPKNAATVQNATIEDAEVQSEDSRVLSEKKGTRYDQRDMRRMGKLQLLRVST